MLEHLINEESDKAKELFHQLVVEKSREIYEQILAEDFQVNEEEDEEEMDESKDEDDEELDESAEEDDEELDEEASEDDEMDESFGFAEGGDEDKGDVGGDAGDDFVDDIDADMGDEEEGSEGEGDLEDRVVDLEDALDELRSEFEALMADEGGDDMGGMDDMGDDMGMDKDLEDSFVREYVEKVGSPKHGDNGANAKSIVAGKNDMGGTTANIVKGGESTSGGTKGGLANPSTKEDNAGNVNVPGGKAGVKHLKKQATPKGGDDGDKSAGSPLNGAPGRAK